MNIILNKEEKYIINKFNENEKIIWKKRSIKNDNFKYDKYIIEIKDNYNLEKCGNIRSCHNYLKVVCGYQQKYAIKIYNILKNIYNFDILNKNIKFIKNLANKIDEIGKPLKVNTFIGSVEGNNIKYIFQSLMIFNHMNKLKLNNINIYEIGGGYGGLSYWIYNLSKLFNIKINSYTIYDLKEASLLQNKFSEYLNFNIKTKQIEEENKIESKNNYLISNYAYSEIPLIHKKKYIIKLFPFIDHGFITWNVHLFNFNLLKNLKLNNIEIEEEKFSSDFIIKF